MNTRNPFTRFIRTLFVRPFGKKVTAAFYLLCPILSFYLLEMLTHDPFADIHTGLHLFSWGIYLLFFSICFFLTGHMNRAFSLAVILVMSVGIINYYTIRFRGSPILPWDTGSLGTALSVVGNQSFQITFRTALILCGFMLLILLSLHCRLHLPSLKKRLAAAAGTALLLAAVTFGLHTDWLTDALNIYEMPFTQGYTYRQNGFVVSYLMNTRYLNVAQPVSYDAMALEETISSVEEQIAGITRETPGSAVRPGSQTAETSLSSSLTLEPGQKPNIIVIMNEAFSDLSVLGDFDTNKDYMPYFRAATHNTISGNAHVSVLGGNTANSEFEFLTGDSMAFLPVGSIPYQQYINAEVPSLVNVLGSQGYRTVAMHPYYASGWDREEVYDHLGFDEKYFLEDFSDSQLLRQYVSDWGMYQKIMTLFTEKEKDEPLFLFGVTMQNHSGYTKDYDNFDPDVHVLEKDYKSVDAYLSLIAQSDRAYERLLQFFSRTDEPTVVVMFGDHQPTSLENSFFTDVFGKSTDLLTLEETALRYQTPFKIWTNYAIDSQQDIDISVNYLAPLVMNVAGLTLSGYQEYLWTLHEALPVVTANFYMDKDGVLHSYQEESVYQTLLDDYAAVQYNHLFDARNRQNELFLLPTELTE